MGLRAMSSERLLGVTARLIATAAVLVVVGTGLVVRFMWQQTGQNLGPDGTAADSGIDLATRITLMVFETGYRPLAMQVLLASVLVAAAVGVLHRTVPSRSRGLRWEVMAAGVVVLAAVMAFVLAHLYVLTTDGSETARADYIGPQSLTEMVLANLSLAAASLSLLTGAFLWWLPAGQAPVEVEEPAEEDVAEESTDGEEDVEHDRPTRRAHQVRDDAMGDALVDYSRDWSPEDFRPPR